MPPSEINKEHGRKWVINCKLGFSINRPVGSELTPRAERRGERYRYLLKAAPLETSKQAHEEAFAKLTPAQRAQALREKGGGRLVNFSSGAGIAGIARDGY